MNKKKKKRKLKWKRIIIALLAIVIFIILLVMLFTNGLSVFEKEVDRYLASDTNRVTLYTYLEDKLDSTDEEVYRGIMVKAFLSKKITYEDNEYVKIKYNNKDYYVKEDNLVDKKDNIALEDSVYVRTACSILESIDDPKILSLAKKGEKLEVVSYDSVDDKGIVNTYQVKQGDITGYVYGKYLVYNEEEAKANYNASVNDPIHSSIKNTYGGGEAINLDFYPVEKPSFENNKMSEAVYALYLNVTVLDNVDSYIEFAKDTEINAFVVDITDNAAIGYPAKIMEQYSKTSYNHATNTYDEYKEAITKLKEAGFYVIGRITVFKDDYYIADHPEDAISSKSTGKPYYHTGAYWPSAYDRDVWYYKVALAKEAAQEFGFNEINFDYVRFPDRLQSVEKSLDMKNTYNEDKAAAIQRFLTYAKDELHKINVYLSADVFGEATNGSYTTAYGQYWPAISNVVDVISGMPYPDHFSKGYYGIAKPWNNPYDLMFNWASEAYKRQQETTSPAVVRTWIQAYDVLSYVDANGIDYNAAELEKEITGLYNANITGGYVTWNSASNLSKFKLQKQAFQIDYLKRYNDENN